MVRLTCLLRRKDGLTPAEFHAYWQEVHGPLIKSSKSGSHVVRYEQHPRPLDDYNGDDDPGFDGVTVQWFEDMDAYRAHMGEPDFPEIWNDISNFLDTTSCTSSSPSTPRRHGRRHGFIPPGLTSWVPVAWLGFGRLERLGRWHQGVSPGTPAGCDRSRWEPVPRQGRAAQGTRLRVRGRGRARSVARAGGRAPPPPPSGAP